MEVEPADGRASGARSENGQSWHGDAVVVAYGSHTPAVVTQLGVHIPDGSVPSMLVITEPARAAAKTVLNTPRAAMRPNPGETFAIDHSWYEDRIVEHEDGTWSIDEATVKELTGEASALLGDAEPLTPASWKLGRKPIPGDGLPVFGELATVPGCHVAFTHSGATLGLIAGELTAYEVLTGTRHPLLAEFRPERFSTTPPGELQTATSPWSSPTGSTTSPATPAGPTSGPTTAQAGSQWSPSVAGGSSAGGRTTRPPADC